MNRSGGGGGTTEYRTSRPTTNNLGGSGPMDRRCGGFQMPLHYPRYRKAEYETMPEWKLDCLLKEYGLPVTGDVHYKRKFAMGAFLWTCA